LNKKEKETIAMGSDLIYFIQCNQQVLDIMIKTAALLGAIISVSIAFSTASYGKRKAKYEFFRDLNEDFLSPEFLKKRKSVASFWMTQFKAAAKVENGHIEVPELAGISDAAITDYLRNRFGVEFNAITNDFLNTHSDEITDTKEVLNRYEHLAKLVELGVISRRDVKIFFYTMLADTFVVCIPFILFRRDSKPLYAHKMQKLIGILPKVSKDWRRA
jgi:hypothetical protein